MDLDKATNYGHGVQKKTPCADMYIVHAAAVSLLGCTHAAADHVLSYLPHTLRRVVGVTASITERHMAAG
jgi:hypothetical protein